MNDTRILQELLLRWEELREEGKEPTVEELCREHPDLAPQLRARIKAVLAMQALVDQPTMEESLALSVSESERGRPGRDATPKEGLSTPSGSKVRCPYCHNPIQIGKQSEDVLCPGCGSSFRLCDTQFTETTSGMKNLGRFQLLERLGVGGFGAVWKARDTELDRIVALKIPHTGLLTERVELERFQREARAAANLRHPNIVTVHEVTTLNSLPVIVAEFVPGVPLKDLLDARRLTFRQTAAVIAEVADALEYAHSLGVVHRDVKPANIMILRESPASAPGNSSASSTESASRKKGDLADVGKPMILDFGLALRDAVETTMTVDGHVLGTPAYMSPEQAAGQSHKADRRSDVYSVGVILYQMLTGELPFRGSRSMMMFQVMHEEPRPPRKINDRIPRDLETICLKCLAKLPAGRYASARELAEDLRRYLAGEPILARPIGVLERVGRWCRRKPGLAIASAAAILGVVIALVTMASAYVVVRDARDDALKVAAEKERLNADLLGANAAEKKAREEAVAQKGLALQQQKTAETERNRAEAEAAKAKTISKYLVGIFESSDPLGLSGITNLIPKATGEKLTASQILDRAATRIEADRTLTPLVRAELLDTIGNVFRSMGRYTEAERLLENALKLREETPGADPLERAASLHNLGWLHHERGNYERALVLYREALKIRQNQPKPDEELVGASQLNLAWLLTEIREHAEAEALLKDLLERRRKRRGEHDRETALTRLALATVYIDSQRFLEAIPLAKQGSDSLLKLEGNELMSAAFGKVQESFVQSFLRDHAGAEKNLIEGLAITKKSLGDRHIYVGFVLYQLAATQIQQKKWADAENNLRECLGIGREQTDMAHPRVRTAVNAMALVLRQRGNAAEATQLYQELLQALGGRFGKGSFHRAEALLDYAAHLENLNAAEKRLEALQEAVDIFRKLPPSRAKLSDRVNLLGVAYFRLQRFQEAEACFRETISQDPKNARAMVNLGNALQKQGRFAEAAGAAQKCLDLPPNSKASQSAAENLLKRCQQLLALEKRLPSVLDKKEPADAADLIALAEMCKQYKMRYRPAVELYEAAFRLQPALVDPRTREHRYNAACAAVLAGTGQGDEAAKLDAAAREALLGRAHDWLSADLDWYSKRVTENQVSAVLQVTQRLPAWLNDAALAGVREAKELAKLAAEERTRWEKLWSDVQKLAARAEGRIEVSNLKGELTAKEKSKIHEQRMTARTTYVIEMESTQFDTFLKLQDAGGALLAENDDIDLKRNQLNSRIVFTPKTDGMYRLVATSYKESGSGAYTLRIRSLRAEK